MATNVTSERDSPESMIRRKSLTAHNAGGMRTEIDMGEYGRIVTDEPAAHGGTGDGRHRCRPCSVPSAAASR